MKKILVVFAIIFVSINLCFSQDIISMKSSGEIQAKIIEITPTEIKYKRFDNPEGPTYTILKSDASSISYENGAKDIFTDSKREEIETKKRDEIATSSNIPIHDSNMQGTVDATKYYRAYKSATTLTFITTLIVPIAGLVPAIVCSSTKPNAEHLGIPKQELIKNPDYFAGYTHRAKKIKQGKVWSNFGIAVGINIVISIALTATQ